MIDIYDEVSHIKNVLQDGFDPDKWVRDLILLVKFRKSQVPQPTKQQVKKEMLEKCYLYVKDFNEIKQGSNVRKLVDKTWKDWNPKTNKLREIRQVKITQEVLDWFLGLQDNFEISQELADKIHQRRKRRVKVKPLSFNDVKYLFTLYVWTLIQAEYIENYKMHKLNKFGARFKQDADLNASFSMRKEKEFLFDLGLINVTHTGIVIPIFMDNNEAFKVEATDKNTILLTGDDLYFCGYWLKKQKMGSFICANCRKEIANYRENDKKRRRPRKYCKECAEKLKKEESGHEFCVICGKKLFTTFVRKYNTCYCASCAVDRNREQKRLWAEKNREKSKKVEEITGKLES